MALIKDNSKQGLIIKTLQPDRRIFMKKRLTGIILILAFLICQIPMGFGSFEAEAADTPGIKILGDFTGSTMDSRFFTYSSKTVIRQSNTVGYGSSTNSMEWVLNSEMYFNLDDVDWSKYKKVHIRLSSSAASNKFNFIFVGSETPGNSNYRKENVTTSSTPGTWTTVSFPVSNMSSVYSKNNNIIGCLKFNYDGWGNSQYTAGSSIFIDRIWLTTEDYENSATFLAPTPSVADGDSYLAADLGNNNKLEFTFAKKLASAEILAAGVEVYDVTTNSEVLTSQQYTVSVNDKKLVLTFAGGLPNGVYKVKLDSSKIYSESGAKLAQDYSIVFSVGVGSLNFRVSSTEPANGATGVAAFATNTFQYKIKFNNNLDTTLDYTEYITFKRGNTDITSSLTSVSAEGKEIIITVPSAVLYGSTTYTVSVSGTLHDNDGVGVEGDLEFTFTTAKKVREAKDGVVFDANDPEDMYTSKGQVYTSDTFIYNEVTGVKCEANSSVERVFSTKKADITGYTYINLLINNSSADSFYHNFVLRNSSGTAYVLYRISTEKAGWQLVTIPLSAHYTKSGTLDKTAVDSYSINIGGWASGKPASDFDLKIGRIWLSNSAPSGVPDFVSSEFGDESDFVEPNLGGDNKVTFNFDANLYDGDYSDIVKVEKLSGQDFTEVSDGYTVEISGKVLDVVFPSDIQNGETYRITLKGAVASESYCVAKVDASSVITVGAASPYFKVKEVSLPADTSVLQANFVSYDITFNNPVETSLKAEDYVSLYKDGARMFGGYTLSAQDKKLIVKFDSVPEAATYTVEIIAGYKDTYGNTLTGTSAFDFTISESKVLSDDNIIVFSPDNADQMATATGNGNVEESTENTNIYSKNVKITIDSNSDISSYFSYDTIDTSKMGYFNVMMYVPQECAEEHIVNLVLYKDIASNSYARYEKALTPGWNIITQAISLAEVEKVNINFGGWLTKWENSGYVFIEQVWFSKSYPSALELLKTSLPSDYTGAAISGQKITFDFSDKLLEEQTPVISVATANGTPVSDYTAEISENSLTLNFGTLTDSETYVVKIEKLISNQLMNLKSQVNYKFTTADGGIYINDFAFDAQTLVPGNTIGASFKFDNITSQTKNVNLNFVAVTKDGVLSYISSEDISVAPGQTPVSKSISTASDTEFVKLFVTYNNAVVDGKYFELSKNGLKEYKTAISENIATEIKFDNVKVNSDIIVVSGKSVMAKMPVAVTLKDNSGNIIAKDVIMADTLGVFSYGTKMPSSILTGEYDFTALSCGKENSVKIKYFDEQDRNSFLSLANGSDKSALANWLFSNRKVTDLPEMSVAMSSDVADIILSSGTYGSYSDAYSKLNEVSDSVNSLNSSTWQTMASIIVNNKDVLINSQSTQKSAFMGLNEKGRNAVCIELVKEIPFNSITEFTASFDKKTSEYILSQNRVPSSPSGGSSSKVSVGGAVSVPDKVTPVESMVFSDLSGYEWAKESIVSLHKKGVISSASDNKYRPGDSITREEFIKLLVESFFAEYISSDEAMYSDAKAGEWYNKYLVAASKAEITTGKGDGSFGVGETITREDMVTMAGRTLEKCGYNLNKVASEEFSDKAQISSYASEYVDALVSLGILNGMGDGSFAPKNSANRAQAAKIINSLVEKYN